MRAVVLILALAALGPVSGFLARPGISGIYSPRALKNKPVSAGILSDMFRPKKLQSTADVVSAEESVDRATRHWCSTVTSGAEDNWKRVTALYAIDAQLWGTVSEDLRVKQDLVDYFKYFAHIPGLSLQPGSYKSEVQVLGDSAINSGYYTFEMPKEDGTLKVVPARFTFVYRKLAEPTADGIEWEIVNHHSSAVPDQPPALKPTLAQSVDKATRHWCSTVTSGAQDNWQKVTSLYATDAQLWGTVSEDLRGKQDLVDYFKYFAHIPGLSLKPGSYKSEVQVLGDSAINSGYYTFEMPKDDGSIKSVPARFTFVYRKLAEASDDGIEWEIVNHHSSAVPDQPEALKPIIARA